MILFSLLASMLFIGGVSTETPTVSAQTRVGSLSLSKGENGFSSAVKDRDYPFAYFGTATKPGIIVQVLLGHKSSYEYTLNEFHVLQTLTLNDEEDVPTAAVFDPQWGIAYFGTRAGYLVQVVKGGDGLHRGSSLDLQVQKINCGVVDSDSTKDFAYFGAAGTTPYDRRIVKVKIGPAGSQLALVDTLHLNLNEGFPWSAVIDTVNGFAYFGTSEGIIVKVRLSDFTRAGTLALNVGDNTGLVSAVIDVANGYAYFGTWESKIVKIRLSDFTLAGTLTLQSGEKFLYSAIIDIASRFAYFGTDTGVIVRVRLSDFTRVGALVLTNPLITNLASAVIDIDNGFAYFGGGGNPGRIVKVSLSDFTYVDALTLVKSEDKLYSAVVDSTEGFAYFGTGTHPGIVTRIRLSDFTRTGALMLNEGEDSISSAVFFTVGQFRTALFGTATCPGRVVAVSLTGILERQGACILNDNECDLQSAVIDPGSNFAYFGTYTDPGTVVKVNALAPARWGALTLNLGEGLLTSAVIDTTNGFAYFGTNTDPGKIVKIRLSDFTRVGAITLNPGERYLRSAVIDSANGFAYFGTHTQPGIIVKVRLSDFTRVSTLTLNPGESALTSAVIDTAKGFAYFGTTTDPGLVVKVRLSDFTRVGALTLDPGELYLRSAVIDASKGFAYFGTSTEPGIVVKISLDEPKTLMMTYKPYLVTSTKPTTVTTTYTTMTQFWVPTWELKTTTIATTYAYASFSPSYFRRMVTSTGVTTITTSVLGVRGPFTVVTLYTTTYATAAVSMVPKSATVTTTFMALTSTLSSVWRTFSGKGTATYVTYVVMEQTLTSTITLSHTTEAPQPSKGPCIIASAAYGSELAPEVQLLRTFRDKTVQSTFAGTNFMKVFNRFYYSFSPTVASAVAESPLLSHIVRSLIYPLIAALNIASAIFHAFGLSPELAVTVSGIAASVLIGVSYFAAPLIAAKVLAGRRRNSRLFASKRT
jgi:hypothetical protein